MNTLEQKIRATAKKKSKELQANPAAYVDGVGRVDMDNLGKDMSAQSVAVRLVLGATVEMPHRALSYVESAARIATHFPNSQLQIVHANHLGNRINNVDLDQTRSSAQALASHTLDIVARIPELEGRITHAIDTPHDTDAHLEAVEEMYRNNPSLSATMRQKGAKHGGDADRYTAAHFAFQDTDTLEMDIIVGAPQQAVDTIIGIGCQQERNFYMARMGMHAYIAPSVTTAQIFTRHLTPPYYIARGGEPLLDTPFDLASVGDSSARRDLEHHAIHTGEV